MYRVRLGANAGIGISLGDDCIVEAGCCITGGSRVQMPNGSTMKAKELPGQNGILFRRDSQSGALHAIPRNKRWGELNAELHKNCVFSFSQNKAAGLRKWARRFSSFGDEHLLATTDTRHG